MYLNFIVGKFGDEGARQIAATGGTTSQGFDFGAWLLRNCYDVCEMPAQTRFQRRTRAVGIPDDVVLAAKSKAMPEASGRGSGRRG